MMGRAYESSRHQQLVAHVAAMAATEVGRGASALFRASDRNSLWKAMLAMANRRVRIAIVTGFYIADGTPAAAETDGPIGATQLAVSLSEMGHKVTIITDSLCAPIVLAACLGNVPEENVEIHDKPSTISTEYQVSIAVERPGKTTDGTYRNMRGRDITTTTAPLDEWFAAGSFTRIAIGDGGNEIGMGLLETQVVEGAVHAGPLIRCVVPCDHLIVAGTSNWGAYALSAALTLAGGPQALLDETWSKETLNRIISAGAIDGVSKQSVESVDGLVWSDYWGVPKQIKDLVSQKI